MTSQSNAPGDAGTTDPHSSPKIEQHDFSRVPFFDFQPLEPLTHGTDLPEVPPEELSPQEPEPPKSDSSKSESPKSESPKPAPTPETIPIQHPKGSDAPEPSAAAPGSPPLSPTKPVSVRRFLSRVSINSNYNDDKSSVFSNSLAPEETKKKKRSWWSRKVKRHSMMPAVGGGKVVIPGLEDNEVAQKKQSAPPPPRLPDDMFGKDLAALDGDMFSNLRIDDNAPARK